MSSLIPDDELVSRFAGHQLDHDSAAHYRGRLERRLLINRCGECGTLAPPADAGLPGLLEQPTWNRPR